MVCVTHRAFLISLFSLCRGGLHELEELVEEASLAASNAPASSKLVSLRGTEEDSVSCGTTFPAYGHMLGFAGQGAAEIQAGGRVVRQAKRKSAAGHGVEARHTGSHEDEIIDGSCSGVAAAGSWDNVCAGLQQVPSRLDKTQHAVRLRCCCSGSAMPDLLVEHVAGEAEEGFGKKVQLLSCTLAPCLPASLLRDLWHGAQA